MSDTLLTVRDLRVSYPGDHGTVLAVRGASFDLGRERLGIVGESGSGKSTLGRAIMGLVSPPGRVEAATLKLGDTDLSALDERGWRGVRGRKIAMVLQDPKFSLNPTMTIGRQIAETRSTHLRGTKAEARRATLDMLAAVRIDDPARVAKLYPGEVSGGMGQRAMIAMMLAADPGVLIADEPTSALDVTVQVQVLAILDDLVRRRGMGLILISHNLPLVRAFCDRVLVMYAGRIVESCIASDLDHARHPYTRGLLDATPELRHRRVELPQLQRDPAWLADAGD